MFRREWRQQLTVLALLAVAVAAAVLGVAFAADAPSSPGAIFGSANHLLTVAGPQSRLTAGISAARSAFGRIEVIEHAKATVPGSVNAVDVRAVPPRGSYSAPMLRLDAGRYPGPGQVAVTSGVAAIYRLHIGSAWRTGGRWLRVVGVVENPADLQDEFALVAPGQVRNADEVTILFDATVRQAHSFRLPVGAQLAARPARSQGFPPAAVLVLDTIALLFVGLIAVAAFTVLAQRRQHALGMLAAIGATGRQIRLAVLGNGAVVGTIGAAAGTAVGLAIWAALVPGIETLVSHRIGTFSLPWWEIAVAIILTVATSVAAAWWPALAASRVPVVAALSGRPHHPGQSRRFAALGAVLLTAGLAGIALARQGRVPPLAIGGVILSGTGVLLLGPLAIGVLAGPARHAPVPVRLAFRGLARYRARSGAALAAVSLVTGIVAAIAVSAAVAAQNEGAPGAAGWANLPPGQLIVYLSPQATDSLPEIVPSLTYAQAAQYQAEVQSLAASLHSTAVVAVDAAVSPGLTPLPELGTTGLLTSVLAVPVSGSGRGLKFVAQLYVATPALLRFENVSPAALGSAADVVTARSGLHSARIVRFGARRRPGGRGRVSPQQHELAAPVISSAALPHYTSAPNTLLTTHAMTALGLRPVPAGWLVQVRGVLTAAQVSRADHWAAANGLTVQTPTGSPQASLASVSGKAVAVGVLAVLAVLAMTIGLIRGETAGEERVLAATGASGGTRRLLTGATAATLALLGGLIGTAAAYLGIIAWNRGVHGLASVPVARLAVLIAGIPLAALAAGCLLAGREPAAIARRPLD